jgi:chromosomal replication initiation ATPase DnaA
MDYEDFEVVLKPEPIKKAVAEFFGCDVDSFMVESRKMEKTFLRHLTRYFMFKYCGLTENKVARLTLTKDHSSTHHSCKTIEDWLFIGDEKTEAAVAGITQSLMLKYGVALVLNAEATSLKRIPRAKNEVAMQ